MARNKEQNEIGELVRKAQNDYTTGTTTISKYVEFSQYENIEKIDAYVNSKHTSGEVDSMNREKPFFNIVTAARNIWYRATDIDRKHIRIKATKISQHLAAFVATIHLQEWMRKTGFGSFLNDWGRALATYGSSVLKFVTKDGELIPAVIPWNRLITDTVDFENNPVIEKLWVTPAQLLQNKAYDQEMVEKLLDAIEARETLDGQKKDNKSGYIELFEVHGNLPLSYKTGKKKDDDTYRQQMHVISFLAKKDNPQEFDDYTLYKGLEAKSPYMLTHLIKEDGRAQAIGAVEHLFEAQWMTNHTMKNIKDYLDFSSKIILQTTDGNFVGQNVLSDMQMGDFVTTAPNSAITTIHTEKGDITALQNFGTQWQVLAKEIVATPEALTGGVSNDMAWRAIEAQRQEAHSLFELMTENKGLHIVDMMTNFVLPHLKTKFDNTDELTATLDAQYLHEFDSKYVPNEAIRRNNDRIKKQILSGEIAENVDPTTIEPDIKKELANYGNQRFIKPSDLDNKKWKEVLKDLEWDVEVEVTDEAVDKQAVMTTLTTVLQTLATNPMVLQDPNMKMIFNRILEETGAISTLELANVPAPQMQQPTPVGGSNVAPQPVMQEMMTK
jgi:hypothetical protein